jgi:hypothetical protein
MNDEVLWLSAIGAGIGLVLAFGFYSRRRLISNRRPIDTEVIHSNLSVEIDFYALRDTLNTLGKAFSIDPKLIRPDDYLSEYIRADSWNLGAGSERLDQWLIENKISVRLTSVSTVLDLAQILENSRQKQRSEHSEIEIVKQGS